jgi:hypothetical protein
MAKGKFKWMMCEPGFVATTWEDTKTVCYLSNCIPPLQTIEPENNNSSKKMKYPMPQVAKQYRKYYHLTGNANIRIIYNINC